MPQSLRRGHPLTKIVVTYPPEIADAEKERFRQFETAGIENLRTCDLTELTRFLASLAQPDTEALEDALVDQEDTDPGPTRRKPSQAL